MRKRENYFDKIKNKDNFININNINKDEFVWIGAGTISALVFGLIDGGCSVAIAYFATKFKDKILK